jgi:hypothetical protein
MLLVPPAFEHQMCCNCAFAKQLAVLLACLHVVLSGSSCFVFPGKPLETLINGWPAKCTAHVNARG